MRELKSGKLGEVYNIGGNNERYNIDIVKIILTALRQETGDRISMNPSFGM